MAKRMEGLIILIGKEIFFLVDLMVTGLMEWSLWKMGQLGVEIL